jgi:hypothetical protein
VFGVEQDNLKFEGSSNAIEYICAQFIYRSLKALSACEVAETNPAFRNTVMRQLGCTVLLKNK